MFNAFSRFDSDFAVAAFDMFLHHDAQISARKRRAGGNPHRLSRFQIARFPIGGMNRIHDLKTFGFVAFQNGKAIAR